MSGSDSRLDSASLEILDAALRRSAAQTESFAAEEMLAKMQLVPKDLQRLTDSLRDPPPAAMWLKDPWLAMYLPLVLRLQDTAIDDPGRSGALQRLLVGEADHRTWRWTPWIYPSILFMAAILVAVLLGTTIVPMFKQMFLEFGLRLPEPTKCLIWMSDSMILHPIRSAGAVIVLLSLLGSAGIGLRWIEERIPSGSMLAILLSGSRRHVLGMARWTGSLAEMLRLDIPIPQAIALAGILSCRYSLETESMRLARESRNVGDTGASTGSNVKRRWSFSPVAMAALQYPDAQKRVALLRGLSDLYWNRLMISSRTNAGWIAPLTVVLLGAFIAFVVLALFMPLISLITSLSG